MDKNQENPSIGETRETDKDESEMEEYGYFEYSEEHSRYLPYVGIRPKRDKTLYTEFDENNRCYLKTAIAAKTVN